MVIDEHLDFEIGKRLFTTHMAVQLVMASPEGREIGSLVSFAYRYIVTF